MKNLNTVLLRPGFVVDAKDRGFSIPLKFPVDGLNMLDNLVIKKFSKSLSDSLVLPAKSIQLEVLAGYAAAGCLGQLQTRIYSNEEMIENYKNLNRH